MHKKSRPYLIKIAGNKTNTDVILEMHTYSHQPALLAQISITTL